jgi:hypothetical protein
MNTNMIVHTKLIKETNMKYRCICMSIMCTTSVYNFYNYSLYDPIINEINKPYYQNCLIFILYLMWDIQQMTFSKNNNILFRKDLMIHHVFSLLLICICINFTSLENSHVLFMECLSVFNYILRDAKYSRILNYYRLFCICCIRMPLCAYMMLYYNPNYLIPYYKSIYNDTIYNDKFLWAYYLNYCFYFYILYDLFLIKQVYKNLFRPVIMSGNL